MKEIKQDDIKSEKVSKEDERNGVEKSRSFCDTNC